MANDPKNFDPEAFCEAIRSWARQHPTVKLEDIADVLDTAPDAESVDRFLADPNNWRPSLAEK